MATETVDRLQAKLEELIADGELRSIQTSAGRQEIPTGAYPKVRDGMLTWKTDGNWHGTSLSEITEVNDQGVGDGDTG